MNESDVLNQITVPSPCPMDWSQMSGDDRVRYCPACGKHVHNFAEMTAAEATSLVRNSDGDLCGRLSRYDDGTLVTADRGVAAESRKFPWQFKIRSLMGVIAGFATIFGIARLIAGEKPNPSRLPAVPPTLRATGGLICVRETPPVAPTNTSPSPAPEESSGH